MPGKNNPSGFSFRGEFHGSWVALHFGWNHSIHTFTTSYIGTDGLRNLLLATRSVAKGHGQGEASFFDEPGEWILGLETETQPHQPSSLLTARLYQFHEFYQQALTEIGHRGRMIFEFEVPLIQFTTQIARQFQAWEQDPGPEAYLKGWKHHFPSNTLQEIQQILKEWN